MLHAILTKASLDKNNWPDEQANLAAEIVGKKDFPIAVKAMGRAWDFVLEQMFEYEDPNGAHLWTGLEIGVDPDLEAEWSAVFGPRPRPVVEVGLHSLFIQIVEADKRVLNPARWPMILPKLVAAATRVVEERMEKEMEEENKINNLF